MNKDSHNNGKDIMLDDFELCDCGKHPQGIHIIIGRSSSPKEYFCSVNADVGLVEQIQSARRDIIDTLILDLKKLQND